MKRTNFLFVAVIAILAVSLLMVQPVEAGKDKPCKAKADPFTVWDGEEWGLNAQFWASPEDNPDVLSEFSFEEGVGYDSDVAVKWHAEGADWKGYGLNWYGWWPADAGDDVSKLCFLIFMMKVEIAEGAMGPNPDGFQVGLACSGNGNKETDWVSAASFMPDVDLFDGEWHEVKIPLKALWETEKGKEVDAKTIWEFRMGEWSGEPQNYTVYVDNIRFE